MQGEIISGMLSNNIGKAYDKKWKMKSTKRDERRMSINNNNCNTLHRRFLQYFDAVAPQNQDGLGSIFSKCFYRQNLTILQDRNVDSGRRFQHENVKSKKK